MLQAQQRHRRFVFVGILLAWAGSSSVAHAQMTGNVDKLKADLHGDNLDRAVAAASALGSLATDDAAKALLGALQLGAPPKLSVAIIEALGQVKRPIAIPLLRHFAGYRRPIVRVAAIEALAQMPKDPQVVPILVDALGDSSPMVRANAARVLAAMGARAAEIPLFKMLRRGDKAAAEPLGTVAGVETAKQLAELIGELPDASIAEAFGAMLKRPTFGPDPLRNEIVKALCKIPGTDATAAIMEYIASVPAKDVRISKTTAEKCVETRK